MGPPGTPAELPLSLQAWTHPNMAIGATGTGHKARLSPEIWVRPTTAGPGTGLCSPACWHHSASAWLGQLPPQSPACLHWPGSPGQPSGEQGRVRGQSSEWRGSLYPLAWALHCTSRAHIPKEKMSTAVLSATSEREEHVGRSQTGQAGQGHRAFPTHHRIPGGRSASSAAPPAQPGWGSGGRREVL